jgi:hypothetical protein
MTPGAVGKLLSKLKHGGVRRKGKLGEWMITLTEEYAGKGQ